jgi:Nuclease-related domain
MSQSLFVALFMVVAFVPLFSFLGLLIWERWLERRKRQSPFRELRRRPAGEALRIKIAELDEKIDERLYFLAGPPVIVAVMLSILPGNKGMFLGFSFIFALLWTGIVGWGIRRLIRERIDYRLGFDGERYVGEELSRLIAFGYEIYHDVPFEKFNIDHVLVGPGGVYSIETKTRRKPLSTAGGKDYHVRFDGTRLEWPWGADPESVQQTALNARTLTNWLSSAVGERVNVTPVLALPGWMVDRLSAPKGLYVLNPKEISKLVNTKESKAAPLSASMIQRICHQLDQKCRVGVD